MAAMPSYYYPLLARLHWPVGSVCEPSPPGPTFLCMAEMTPIAGCPGWSPIPLAREHTHITTIPHCLNWLTVPSAIFLIHVLLLVVLVFRERMPRQKSRSNGCQRHERTGVLGTTCFTLRSMQPPRRLHSTRGCSWAKWVTSQWTHTQME